MVRVLFNSLGDWGSILGRVISKTQKWYLMPACLTLCIIRYGSKVSGAKEVALGYRVYFLRR